MYGLLSLVGILGFLRISAVLVRFNLSSSMSKYGGVCGRLFWLNKFKLDVVRDALFVFTLNGEGGVGVSVC